MDDDRIERLQLQILKLVSDRGPTGVYKYNLTGRDAAGELELSFRERWSTEERRVAAEAFDDLKRCRLIQSTMTNSIDTDNWVTITQAGKGALAAGKIKTVGAQKIETQSRDLVEFLSAQLQLDTPTGVIFSDLDNFKAVNDTHHHEGGDRCIDGFQALARAIVEGRGKLFRRYATGDEFIAVLPNCTAMEAAATAERIRRAVEASDIGQTLPVTVSLGVCSSADHAGTDAVVLIKIADGLMYRAKQKKNAVVSDDVASVASGSAKLTDSLERWINESRIRWAAVIKERVSAANPSLYVFRGTWSFAYANDIGRGPVSLPELLQILRDMPGQTTCIRPWHVPSSEGRRPYPFEGVLECWPAVTPDGFSPQFWRAAPELKMFYVRKYEQDERDELDTVLAGSRFDLRNAIWRIGECVMHAARFNAALKLTSGVTGLRVARTGLKNRQLISGTDSESFRCRQDTVESYTAASVGDLEHGLVEVVRSLLSPLYEAFDMYELNGESLRNELSRMLAECGGHRP